MSILSKKYFYNEKAAFKYVESIIWANGKSCPHCGNAGKIYELKGKSVRLGLNKCGECRKQFTVRVGTIFEDSHLPLHKWLQAIYLMSSSKKGISSHQLHRTLEVTYKTAWFLSHRIREAMKDDKIDMIGGKDKVVEADETFLGNKGKQRKGARDDYITKFRNDTTIIPACIKVETISKIEDPKNEVESLFGSIKFNEGEESAGKYIRRIREEGCE